jgi:2'-hydroxyisoflavone reductase
MCDAHATHLRRVRRAHFEFRTRATRATVAAMFNRRDLIKGGLIAAAAACTTSKSKPGATAAKPVAKKRILILGGTGFLGPATIEAAVARGHSVTIFNRGKREKYLPLKHPVEHLYGNRDPKLNSDEEDPTSPKGLAQLEGKKFDVVIDNSGYVPRIVQASAELLANNVSRYIFISSISAYDDSAIPERGGDETAKLATLADPTTESMGDQFQNYGGLKVLCEKAAEAAMPGRATIVRPGYIVGPGDPTDRFTYWPVRVAGGGEIIAPGAPDDPLQWIDVRDLGEWLVTLAENETVGTFNAVGPQTPARWGDVLQSCVKAAGPKAGKLTWVPTEWLEANEMGGEDSFPIWIPPKGKFAGFHRWNPARAVAAGLTYRTIDDTNTALLEWFPKELERRVRVTAEMQEAAKAKGKEPPKMADPSALRAGPPRERELELLAKFHAADKGAMK